MMSQLEIRTTGHQPDKTQLYHKPHWPDRLHSFKTLPSPYFGTSWPVQQLLVVWCQEEWSDLAHSYMDKNIQKAFVNGIPKCFEHQGKLAIDLAIAYGIVHHQLIHFTPSASWFTLWSTSTPTSMWLSRHIDNTGIPPQLEFSKVIHSVAIFNNVMCTLIEDLHLLRHYKLLPEPRHNIQYFVDTCLMQRHSSDRRYQREDSDLQRMMQTTSGPKQSRNSHPNFSNAILNQLRGINCWVQGFWGCVMAKFESILWQVKKL